jgi:HEPN domain-containing protein
MTDPRLVLRVAIEWFTSAEEDLQTAGLLNEHGAPARSVAFFAQQAAEKAAKAMCAALQLPLLKTHSLAVLMTNLETVNPDFVADWRELEELSGYAVESRYPDSAKPVFPEEAKAALQLASEFLSAVSQWLTTRPQS